MRSHFHRSDGFEACSQWLRVRERQRVDRAVDRVVPEGGAERRAHLGRACVGHRHAERDAEVHEDLPVLERLTWRRDRPGRSLHPALVVCVRGVLLDVRGARQDEIRGHGERRHLDTLHDEQGERARTPGLDDPRDVANSSLGARIEHVERRHLAGVDRPA